MNWVFNVQVEVLNHQAFSEDFLASSSEKTALIRVIDAALQMNDYLTHFGASVFL